MTYVNGQYIFLFLCVSHQEHETPVCVLYVMYINILNILQYVYK